MDNEKLSRAIVDLANLAKRLRGKDGCPWDAKQTDETIKTYLIEEAYEVLDAVEKGSPADVCEELGDLLFQIVFLALLAEERDEFDLVDVLDNITKKMIRRHPHVFDDKKVNGVEDVINNWVAIKMKEKDMDKEEILNGIPNNLPALLRAHRLSERASKMNFDWNDRDEVWKKVQEEYVELSKAVEKRDKKAVTEEIGDLIFSIVNLARHWGENAEHIMRMANNKFLERFARMKEILKESHVSMEEASSKDMDKAWERVKREERDI